MKRIAIVAAFTLLSSVFVMAQEPAQSRRQNENRNQSGVQTQNTDQYRNQGMEISEQARSRNEIRKAEKMQQKELKSQGAGQNNNAVIEQRGTAIQNKGARTATPRGTAVQTSGKAGRGRK